MKRLCGWCGVSLGEKEPLDDVTETHGICVPCADSLIVQYLTESKHGDQEGDSEEVHF